MSRAAAAGSPTIAIAYLRVSTEEQNLGPAAQLAAIGKWADAAGIHIAAVLEDHGVSGAAPLDRRLGMIAALDGLRAHGAGVLVVAKRDRLSRDPLVGAMIEAAAARAGARIVSAAGEGTDNDDPTSVLMRRIVDAFGEYERLIIKARTRAALQIKKGRGERYRGFGSAPYGFDVDEAAGTQTPRADEQEVIARILDMHAAGASLNRIADALNADGVTARGAKWYPMTVSRIVKRAAPTAAVAA